MKSTIRWTEGRSFEATTEDGFKVAIGNAHGDVPKPGPSAMELILMGAGTCSAHDVVSILEKSRQDVEDVTVALSAERAGTMPSVFTRIHMHFVVKGRSIKPANVERALQLSVEKYCSATKMLQATVDISHDFEIVEVD